VELRPRSRPARPAEVPADPDASRWAAVWQYRPYLLAIARRRVSWHDAEDVVHEAVLRGVREILVPEVRLQSWLTTTVIRLCADRHREDSALRRRTARWGARPEPSAVPGPVDDVCDAAEAVWVAEQVDRLPQRQAQALRLRAQGLSLAEVGVEMGVPAKSVESMLGRARRVLKAAAATAAAIVLGAKVLVKRKTQVHVAALALGAACSGGMYCLDAGQDAASSGMKRVGAAVAPSLHDAMRWARVTHGTGHDRSAGSPSATVRDGGTPQR
jgi:RNA polymerase sigma factor (sigma-70 family)